MQPPCCETRTTPKRLSRQRSIIIKRADFNLKQIRVGFQNDSPYFHKSQQQKAKSFSIVNEALMRKKNDLIRLITRYRDQYQPLHSSVGRMSVAPTSPSLSPYDIKVPILSPIRATRKKRKSRKQESHLTNKLVDVSLVVIAEKEKRQSLPELKSVRQCKYYRSKANKSTRNSIRHREKAKTDIKKTVMRTIKTQASNEQNYTPWETKGDLFRQHPLDFSRKHKPEK